MEEIKVGTKIKWKETGRIYEVVKIKIFIGWREPEALFKCKDLSSSTYGNISLKELNQMWRDNKCEILAD